jgi:mycofactocin precursor
MPEIAVDDHLTTAQSGSESPAEAPLEIADLMVEDVSIDGMCGVY